MAIVKQQNAEINCTFKQYAIVEFETRDCYVRLSGDPKTSALWAYQSLYFGGNHRCYFHAFDKRCNNVANKIGYESCFNSHKQNPIIFDYDDVLNNREKDSQKMRVQVVLPYHPSEAEFEFSLAYGSDSVSFFYIDKSGYLMLLKRKGFQPVYGQGYYENYKYIILDYYNKQIRPDIVKVYQAVK